MMALCTLRPACTSSKPPFQTRRVSSDKVYTAARVGFPQHLTLDPPRCRPPLWRNQNYTEINDDGKAIPRSARFRFGVSG